MDLGTLGWYGRWLDVNWVWAVWLTLYHAVVSIAIPIFLMEWIWPRVRGQPLTGRRGYITAIALLAGATIFINILLTPYRPSVWHLLGAFAVVVFLVWAAKKYAGVLWSRLPCRKASASPRVYALAGFAFLMGSFLLYGGGPSFGLIPIITVLEGAAVLVGVMPLVRRTSDDPRWARQRFAFVAGCVGFLIVLSAFLELAGHRGMGIAGAGSARGPGDARERCRRSPVDGPAAGVARGDHRHGGVLPGGPEGQGPRPPREAGMEGTVASVAGCPDAGDVRAGAPHRRADRA